MAHKSSHRTTLYVGDRIEAAAAKSNVDPAEVVQARPRILEWVVRLICEFQNMSWPSLRWKACVVRGREITTGKSLVIHFRGSLKLIDFCTRHILGTTEYSIDGGRAALRAYPPDLVVEYHRLRFHFLRQNRRILLPHRVNQYLTLKSSWQDTLGCLPAKHKKEIRRHLRKYRFKLSLSHGRNAIEHFYRSAYVPYARFRFGENASISKEAPFRIKNRHSFVLWLFSDSVAVGANLLSWRDGTLRIEECGLTPGNESMPGAFDSLDYFSLLLAQLMHCRELDFGGSRPHIKHGIFQYKAKWATEVRTARFLVPKIRIRFNEDSPAVRSFLKRNMFLQFVGNELRVKILVDGKTSDQDVVNRLMKDTGPAGADRLLLVSSNPDRESLASAHRNGVRMLCLSDPDNETVSYLETG